MGGMHKKLKQSFTPKKAVHFCAHCSSKCYRHPTTSHKKDHFLRAFMSCCGISTHTAYFLQNSAHWLHTYCRFQHFRYSPIYATCAACESYVTLMCVFLPFPVISYQTFPKIKIPSPFSLHEIFPVRECWWFCVCQTEKKSEGSYFISVS